MTKRQGLRRTSTSGMGDLMLAPMVVMMRLPLMVVEAHRGASWGTETARAVTEKTAALAEGMVAAQMSMLQSMAGFWPEVFAGRTPAILNGSAAERSLQAALGPASRRVKANFRRLSSGR